MGNKKNNAGYRIHFARLKNIRAEISAMRTHKFLCEIPESGKKDVKEKFGKVAEVVDSSAHGSGMWFLIQMVGMGFLFPSAGNKLLSFQEKFGGDFDFGFPVPNQIALSKRLQTGADNILNIERSFLDIWNVEKLESLQKVAHTILQSIRSEQGDRKFGGRATGLNQWIKDIFAEELECPKVAEIKKGEDWIVFNGAFLEWNDKEISDWIFDKKIPEFFLSDETFPWLLKNILPAAQILGEKPADLMNPYHSLGKLVREFRSTTENLRQILKEQISDSFAQKSQLIDLLCARASECAKAVPPESDDFLAEDWAEYRETNFSGRISGWVSNFQNRLELFQSVLADSVHEKELDEWRIPDVVRDFLLEKRDNGTFIFKSDLPKDFEKKSPLVDEKTGEIISEKKISELYFWKSLSDRKNSIPKCTKNILRTIRKNTDFENIFPKNFQQDFEKLENLCDPLLAKLRATTLGIADENLEGNLGKMIAEYFEFWQPTNEFLQKWANEGVPKMIKIDGENDEQEIVIWDNTKKNPDPKPEKFWIAKSLLVDKKEKEENESDHESELEIVGKWKKSLIPSELPKYPRFLYEAAKDPQKQIFDAANVLPNILTATEKFVGATENQKDQNWEAGNWKTTVKKGEMKWHFGAFHKSLEALLKISVCAKNPKKIVEFLDSFVEWDDAFFENLKTIRSGKTGFDAQKEREKIESAKTEWKKEIAEKRIETEQLANFHFYLSGKEYGFARYGAVPTRSVSMAEFLQRFETHFGLQKGGDVKKFLEIENGGTTDNSATKAELLKFWWARRVQNLAEKIKIPDFSNDAVFAENVLKNLVIGKNEIFRIDAQRFLTAGLGSDIRAKIGLLSRKSFIARNVVQITNGGQTLLQYVPREWGSFEDFVEIPAKNRAQRRRRKLAKKRLLEKQEKGGFGFSESAKTILREAKIDFDGKKNDEIAEAIWKKDLDKNLDLAKVLGEMPHSWNAILKTKQPIEGMLPIASGFFFEKSSEKSIFDLCTKKSDFLYAFPIQTSVIQKQFLERFLWGDRKEILTEKITGPSVILETEKLVQWENAATKIVDGDTKMFVAIPFQFSKGKNISKNSEGIDRFSEIAEKRVLEGTEIEVKKSNRESQKQYRCEKNILGIDLGEYGFGFAILNAEIAEKVANGTATEEDRKKCFVKSGFVEVSLLQKMRDDAASWKDTQSSGIFSRPTTHLANIREQAAGTVRNKIHEIALQFDAIPIYEDSVDGFETGGARISKLYKTLKTSDVIDGNSNEADKSVRKHFWGLDFAQIGGVIGAAKTSQTCRKCGRCATSEIENFAKISENRGENQTGLFSAEKKSVARKNGEKVYFEIFGGKIVGTDILCNLQNGEYEKSEILKIVKKAQRRESEKEKENRELGKRKRGKIEEFECQICKNVTDCDAQAAKNIALKYFFKITATKEEQAIFKDEQTGNFSSLKYFLEKSKQNEWKNL